MKKAWEIEVDTMQSSEPVVLGEEEQGWDECGDTEQSENRDVENLWRSNVPGSHATEHVIIAAIQDTENMGYDVSRAEALIESGIRARESRDHAAMASLAARIFYELRNAPKVLSHPYWSYRLYDSFDDYAAAAVLPRYAFTASDEEYDRLNHIGWLAQICGGALGTAIEGYTGDNLRRVFGEIRGYVRTPNTYNDDITYELAFLEALRLCGRKMTAADIAEQWVALVPTGWSAEDRALRNLKLGIFPPESGRCNNPYREWIGAQMRGAVCGMVAPGDTRRAAEYAFMDATVSHAGNGILGEVFNAVLTSLAYVKTDIQEILKEAIVAIPADSEYYEVISFAMSQCETAVSWKPAWTACEARFRRYNWIHAYPNAAAEVIALYFGQGDFDETMHIIAMEGYDVDCNAAQIGTVVGICSRREVASVWSDPIGDELITYMRKIKKLSIWELAKLTTKLGRL